MTSASLDEIMQGKFEVVMCHPWPEALINSATGQKLMDSDSFTEQVVALVVDECHTVDKW